MRFRIKTILIVIALVAAYLAFARLFLGEFLGIMVLLVLVVVALLVIIPVEVLERVAILAILLFGAAILFVAIRRISHGPDQPAQRPTAGDRPPPREIGPRPSR